MTATKNECRKVVEMAWQTKSGAVFCVGDRPLFAFWTLLQPFTKNVLLSPHSHVSEQKVSWSWLEHEQARMPTAVHLSGIRKRLEGAVEAIEEAIAEEPPASTQKVFSEAVSVLKGLAMKSDSALLSFCAPTVSGVMLHSWSFRRAGVPLSLDSIEREIQGTVSVGGTPAGGQEVVLEDSRGTVLARTRTDRAGQFIFGDLTTGRFRVRGVSDQIDFPVTGLVVDLTQGGVRGLQLKSSATGKPRTPKDGNPSADTAVGGGREDARNSSSLTPLGSSVDHPSRDRRWRGLAVLVLTTVVGIVGLVVWDVPREPRRHEGQDHRLKETENDSLPAEVSEKTPELSDTTSPALGDRHRRVAAGILQTRSNGAGIEGVDSGLRTHRPQSSYNTGTGFPSSPAVTADRPNMGPNGDDELATESGGSGEDLGADSMVQGKSSYLDKGDAAEMKGEGFEENEGKEVGAAPGELRFKLKDKARVLTSKPRGKSALPVIGSESSLGREAGSGDSVSALPKSDGAAVEGVKPSAGVEGEGARLSASSARTGGGVSGFLDTTSVPVTTPKNDHPPSDSLASVEVTAKMPIQRPEVELDHEKTASPAVPTPAASISSHLERDPVPEKPPEDRAHPERRIGPRVGQQTETSESTSSHPPDTSVTTFSNVASSDLEATSLTTHGTAAASAANPAKPASETRNQPRSSVSAEILPPETAVGPVSTPSHSLSRLMTAIPIPPRLVLSQDAVLTTRPMLEGAEHNVEKQRQNALQESQRQLPGAFAEAALSEGITFTVPSAFLSGSMGRGQARSQEPASTLLVWKDSAGLSVDLGNGAGGKAELAWARLPSTPGRYRLVDLQERCWAELKVKESGQVEVAIVAGVQTHVWIEARLSQNEIGSPGGGFWEKRLKWKSLDGRSLPAQIEDATRLLPAGGLRMEWVVEARPGANLIHRVALVDTVSHWAWLSVVQQTF